MIDLSKEKLELDYPCNWQYKLVGFGEEEIMGAAKEVFGERPFSLTPSKVSKKGKFKSFTVDIIVHNEDDRLELFTILQAHCDIKMVI